MARARLLRDESFWGAETVVLENDLLAVKLVPEKGSDIVEILEKRRGLNLLYRSPVAFHRFGSLSPPLGTDDSGFMDYYEGGWQDILPSPGYPSSYKGARWGLHGETALLPWKARIVDEAGLASVKLTVDLVRFPLRVEKTVSLGEGESVVRIKWEIDNLAEQDVDFAWVQHIVFGRPMMGPGMKVDLKAGECIAGKYPRSRFEAEKPFDWPEAPALNGSTIDVSSEPDDSKRYEDVLYLKMKEPWYAIRNTGLGLTIGVAWDRNAFPYLWYWLNNGVLDYPWWGRSYNLGLELSSSFGEYGIGGFAERGDALHLAEGKKLEAWAVLSVNEGAGSVRDVDATGKLTL